MLVRVGVVVAVVAVFVVVRDDVAVLVSEVVAVLVAVAVAEVVVVRVVVPDVVVVMVRVPVVVTVVDVVALVVALVVAVLLPVVVVSVVVPVLVSEVVVVWDVVADVVVVTEVLAVVVGEVVGDVWQAKVFSTLKASMRSFVSAVLRAQSVSSYRYPATSHSIVVRCPLCLKFKRLRAAAWAPHFWGTRREANFPLSSHTMALSAKLSGKHAWPSLFSTRAWCAQIALPSAMT